MRPEIHYDLNEGQFAILGCLTCHCDVQAWYGVAQNPYRMYRACLLCEDCGEQLVTFDAMTGGVL